MTTKLASMSLHMTLATRATHDDDDDADNDDDDDDDHEVDADDNDGVEKTHVDQIKPRSTVRLVDLRDQTLDFIQKISLFIKCFNEANDGKCLDSELKAIIHSLKSLIRLVETMHLDERLHSLAQINEHMDALDTRLNEMIDELKSNSVERVVDRALDVARLANDLFLSISRLIWNLLFFFSSSSFTSPFQNFFSFYLTTQNVFFLTKPNMNRTAYRT